MMSHIKLTVLLNKYVKNYSMNDNILINTINNHIFFFFHHHQKYGSAVENSFRWVLKF